MRSVNVEACASTVLETRIPWSEAPPIIPNDTTTTVHSVGTSPGWYVANPTTYKNPTKGEARKKRRKL